MDNNDKAKGIYHEELPGEHSDPLIQFLHKNYKGCGEVTCHPDYTGDFLGVGDVIMVLYNRLIAPPVFLLTISDILATFGAFLAVLIAIEIFTNITLYIRNDVLPVKLVVATALMAISRKVIGQYRSRGTALSVSC